MVTWYSIITEAGEVARLRKGAWLPWTLNALEYELLHICPGKEVTEIISFAPMGLLNMFGTGGAVEQFEVHSSSGKKLKPYHEKDPPELSASTGEIHPPMATIALKVRGCGRSGAYFFQRPLKCTVGDAMADFKYDDASGLLTLIIPVPEEEMFKWPIKIQV